MFGVIHRREGLGERFDGELEDAAMMVVTQAINGVPDESKARNLSTPPGVIGCNWNVGQDLS